MQASESMKQRNEDSLTRRPLYAQHIIEKNRYNQTVSGQGLDQRKEWRRFGKMILGWMNISLTCDHLRKGELENKKGKLP